MHASDLASLTVNLRRDDGAIVYVNGVEVFRSNMQSGTNITSTNFASSAASDDGKNWYSTTAPASMLINGTNVCAVEIHQSDTTSTDISFMLQLTGNILTPIKIQIHQFRKDAPFLIGIQAIQSLNPLIILRIRGVR